MKFAIFASFAALILSLNSGCISIFSGNKTPMPRYTVEIDGSHTAGSSIGESRIFTIGTVKSAPEANGIGIRIVHAGTGRTSRLGSGEFAQSPAAMLHSALMSRLAALYPNAVVCDAGLAPRSTRSVIFSAWISKFSLVEDGGSWRFSTSGFLYATGNGKSMHSFPFDFSRSLSSDDTPSPESVAQAVSDILSRDFDAILSQLVSLF